jgi:hypothetical protein
LSLGDGGAEGGDAAGFDGAVAAGETFDGIGEELLALASAVAWCQVPKFGRGKNQGAKPLKRVSAKAREVARAMAVRRLYFT